MAAEGKSTRNLRPRASSLLRSWEMPRMKRRDLSQVLVLIMFYAALGASEVFICYPSVLVLYVTLFKFLRHQVTP